MKPKLLLCLALVLCGGLFGCSTTTRHSTAQSRTLSRSEGAFQLSQLVHQLKPLLPFDVTMTLNTNTVQIGKPFKALLSIKNAGTASQSFKMMSCSWDDQWISFYPRPLMEIDGWVCYHNTAMTVNLAPDESYQFDRALDIAITEDLHTNKITFRLGFCPMVIVKEGEYINGKEIYWSNEATVEVIP